MSADPPSDTRAALAYLQPKFRAEVERHPGLQHILVKAPNAEAFGEAYRLLDGAFHGRYYIRPLLVEVDGELYIFIDDNVFRVNAGIEALLPLSRQAVKMLAENGILQPTAPPPDPSDTREAQPHEKFYSLRQWMLFIHRHAKERPGAPPGVESAPYLDLEHFKLKKGAIAHRLECGVFEASALILGRLLEEVTRGTHQAPTAGPPVGPSPPVGPDWPAEPTEAAADQPVPLSDAELPSPTNRSVTPIEPAAASPAGSPRGNRQAAAVAASGSDDGRLDEPCRDAFTAYRATKVLGQRQEDVAKELVVNQGTISRWVAQVAKWIKVGNVLPDLDAPRPKTVTMDPRRLEQGPRRR
jgi:hypothetical protein